MFKKKKVKKPEFNEEDYDEDLQEEEEEEDEGYRDPEPEVKKNPKLKTWIVQDVATESQRVIVNTKTKKPHDMYSALVEVLNKMDEILKVARE